MLYVDTFDSRRRHNLYLTYFAHGDTRRRGVALLRFKQTYLRSGYVLDESELPDHRNCRTTCAWCWNTPRRSINDWVGACWWTIAQDSNCCGWFSRMPAAPGTAPYKLSLKAR